MAWGKMADEAKVLFENQLFEITPQSNRMGYRLKSEPLTLRTPYVNISSAVDFGTVQLLPSGQLIVLMADAQTTGGYPAIAQVIKADLPLLAQLAPLSVFYFKIISIEEAERKSASQQQRCRKLRCACSFRLADENIL
jgi:antagonist of KipI